MKEVEKKKMSMKIVGVISIIAALGAIIVLVIILMTGGNDKQNDNSNNISDYDQVEKYFTDIKGYWISGNLFFAFKNNDDKHFTQYGLYGSSYSETGEIKDAEITGTNTFCLSVLISATPERTEKICIDVSNFEKENRLNVQIDNDSMGGKEWQTYEYGGSTLEEAYKD